LVKKVNTRQYYGHFTLLMIYSRTVLSVVDNSGAKYVKALNIVGGKKRQYGKLYDAVVVVPKKLKRRGKNSKILVQKRKKYIALIMTTATNTRRRDGSFIKFLTSSVALFGVNGKFLGSTFKSPLCKELKALGTFVDTKKIMSLTRIYL